MNADELKQALDGCDQEPIHLPGSIQPHGYLLVLSENFDIIKTSENFGQLLNAEESDFIGRPLDAFVSRDKLEELKTLVSEGVLNPIRYTTLSFSARPELPAFDAVMHRSGEHLILELEPHDADTGKLVQQDFYREVMQFSVQLQKVQSQKTLYDYVVNQIRKLTGFDRVKLYRFDKDWNGEVIAESKEFHMPSYYGLRFPATDIPKQARALYAKNYLRLIPNTAFEPARLIPDDLDQTGDPIDLSFSYLRSVSPVHMQYLRNMGVGASMSISVMQNDRLWGLIACHHNEPHHLAYPVCMAAELIAHTFSAFLSNFMQSSEESESQKRQACIRELKTSLSSDRSLIETLKNDHALILNAVDADGAIIRINGKFFAFGLIPELSFAEELIQWLEKNHDDQVFVTDSIARDTQLAVKGQSMGSGVLAIPVSTSMSDYVMWFRQELEEEVNWAGKPEKTVTENETGYYLTPRASFSRWKEKVRGFSEAWSHDDIESANQITKLLLNKKYEDSLRQADYDLDSVLKNSSALIYIMSVEGRILKMNESFLEGLALEQNDVVGKNFKDVFDDEFAAFVESSRSEVLSSQKSLTFDNAFVINDRPFRLITVTFPLYDSNDDVYALCSISTDISQLRHTEFELERSNKELERVAFVASHDLQEPIRMISNFSKLLSQEYQDKKLDETANDYLDFTINAAERMRLLIQDLLQYSRLGQDEEAPGSVDTEQEIQSVIKQFSISGEHENAKITVQDDMPEIMMKPEHFGCLIQNFVGNAVKYCPPDRAPIVHIACSDADASWEFSVSDNGIGIKEEYLEKIFIIFQRLHNKTDYQGTGIGLALCSRIIERYSGQIWAESKVGKGSTFFFRIPKIPKIIR